VERGGRDPAYGLRGQASDGEGILVKRRLVIRGIVAEQEVVFHRRRLDDEVWLEITAAVAPEAQLALHAALVHNATLAAGALCIVDGTYRLRFTSPLSMIEPATLSRLGELVAHEAARLRVLRAQPVTPLLTGYE
jgi:hypothetical protein